MKGPTLLPLRIPCAQCGELLHTGEAKIVVGLSLDELEELACATPSASIRRRLICAIGLLDAQRARHVEALTAEAHR